MRHLFDQDDEQAVLDEVTRNQHKAELLSQVHKREGKTRSTASWVASACRISTKILLLEGAFQHKN